MKPIINSLIGLALTLNTSSAWAAKLSSLQETQTIWQHHIDSWKARDLDAIVSDYDEDSVILIRDKAYRGPREIREIFSVFFRLFDRAERHVIDPAIVSPGLVYITWNARIAGKEFPVGTDTFVIAGGKIKFQTVTSSSDLVSGE